MELQRIKQTPHCFTVKRISLTEDNSIFNKFKEALNQKHQGILKILEEVETQKYKTAELKQVSLKLGIKHL